MDASKSNNAKSQEAENHSAFSGGSDPESIGSCLREVAEKLTAGEQWSNLISTAKTLIPVETLGSANAALDCAKQHFDDDDVRFVDTYALLGQTHCSLGDPELALDAFEQALEHIKPYDSQFTLKRAQINRLKAECCLDLRQTQAVDYYLHEASKALHGMIYGKTAPPAPPEVEIEYARIVDLTGDDYLRCGVSGPAVASYEEAHHYWTKHYSADSDKVARSFVKIATAEIARTEFDSAFSALESAYNIRKQRLAATSTDKSPGGRIALHKEEEAFADVVYALAELSSHMGNEEEYQRYKEEFNSLSSISLNFTQQSLCSLSGRCMWTQFHAEDSEKLFKTALRVNRDLFPQKENPTVIAILVDYARFYEKTGDRSLAIDILEKARKIRGRFPQADGPSQRSILSKLGDNYRAQGNWSSEYEVRKGITEEILSDDPESRLTNSESYALRDFALACLHYCALDEAAEIVNWLQENYQNYHNRVEKHLFTEGLMLGARLANMKGDIKTAITLSHQAYVLWMYRDSTDERLAESYLEVNGALKMAAGERETWPSFEILAARALEKADCDYGKAIYFCSNLGKIYRARGEFSKAMDSFRRGLVYSNKNREEGIFQRAELLVDIVELELKMYETSDEAQDPETLARKHLLYDLSNAETALKDLNLEKHPLMKKAIEARIRILEIFYSYDKAEKEKVRLQELFPEEYS